MRLPATALIAANLVVAVVTLYRGWGFYEIIIVYWFEALIIGIEKVSIVAVGPDQIHGGNSLRQIVVVLLIGEANFSR